MLGTSDTKNVEGEFSSLCQLLPVTLSDDQKHLLVTNIDKEEIIDLSSTCLRIKLMGLMGFLSNYFYMLGVLLVSK